MNLLLTLALTSPLALTLTLALRSLALTRATSFLGLGLEQLLVDELVCAPLRDDDVVEELNEHVVFLDSLENVGRDDPLPVVCLGLGSREVQNFTGEEL